jgi:CSLREA domain-containing protein
MRALNPSRRRCAFVLHVAIVLAAGLTATGVCARSAAADVTVHVSTVQDQIAQDSQCSLREAVQYATVSAEPDCASGPPSGVVTILVPPGCYRLNRALLVFGNPLIALVIVGSGAGRG